MESRKGAPRCLFTAQSSPRSLIRPQTAPRPSVSDTHLWCTRSHRNRRGRVRSTFPRICSRRFKSLHPADKDGQSGRDVSASIRTRTCRSRVHVSVPVPGCSRPAKGSTTTPLHLLHLRSPRISAGREDTSILPLCPPSALCGLTPLLLSLPPPFRR